MFFNNETDCPSKNTLHEQKLACLDETQSRSDALRAREPTILNRGIGEPFVFIDDNYHGDEDDDDDDGDDADIIHKNEGGHNDDDEEGTGYNDHDEGGNDDHDDEAEVNDDDEVDNDGDEDSDSDDSKDELELDLVDDGQNEESRGEHEHPLEGVWNVRYSQSKVLERMKIKSVKDGKIIGKISFIYSPRYTIVGDYKTEKGSPGGVLDFDVLVREPGGLLKATRFCSAFYDADREVIRGTWTGRWANPAVPGEERVSRGEFIARRIPFHRYFLRDIFDAPSDLDVVDSAEPSLARRRWRYAIECVRSRTEARLSSRDLAVARLKASRELIKLHYESFSRGMEGEIPSESYLKMISLGIPYSSLFLQYAVNRDVAEYRYERLLDDW